MTRTLVIGIGALVVGVLVGMQIPQRRGPMDAASAATSAKMESEKSPVTIPASGEKRLVLGTVCGVKNFVVKYDDKLFRGGELQSEEGARNLVAWGVRTVLSAVPSDQERLLCKTYGLGLVEVPFEKTALTDDVLDRAMAVYQKGEPVYVHCHGGTHRGGALSVLYRLAVRGWKAEDALREYDELGGDPYKTDKPMMDAIQAYVARIKSQPKTEE